jgi:predicted phosphodiesterase
MVTSDYHIPFEDKKAVNVMLKYAKHYKPNVFVINGDFVDFYRVSKYDKNPDRKETIQDELDLAEAYLKQINTVLPKKTEKYYLYSNHEGRLEQFLWRNPELYGLKILKIENLLNLKEYGFKFIGGSYDYWKNDNGHLQLGEVLIMHGDNRLNGASTSKYAGYSAKNTMYSLQKSVVLGHTHRMAIVNHTSPYNRLYGIEGGHLSQPTGTANWQQGFVTFELYKGKMINPRLHYIHDGKIYEDGKVYK